MLLFWPWLLALTLLVGCGEAQKCRPPPGDPSARNLAVRHRATQSSTYKVHIAGTAGKAVDGNCSGFWRRRSCTQTKYQKEPWWYVDLGAEHAISTVVVKNREDCCGQRLRGAQVHVGNSVDDRRKPSHLCGTIVNTVPGSISTIYCNGQKGRFVIVSIPDRRESLSLCEVEVYGTK